MEPTQDPTPTPEPPPGSRVRQLRRERGLTVGQVARQAGVTWMQLRNLEAGLGTPPHVLAAVLAVLGKGAASD